MCPLPGPAARRIIVLVKPLARLLALALPLAFLIASPLAAAPASGSAPPINVDPSMLPENLNKFARQFLADYLSWDVARMGKWISPARGVIDLRILYTRDQFLGAYPTLAGEMKAANVTYQFGEGAFEGQRFYRASFVKTGGKLQGSVAPINFTCSFERIGNAWYLVQVNRLDAVSSDWLMVGDHIEDQDLVGPTLSGKQFSLAYAVHKGYPTLLSFFDKQQDLILPTNMYHLRAVHKWFVDLKGKPIFVMNVSDYPADTVREYLTNYQLQMPVLLDKTEIWHKILQVDQHPYLILIDKDGTLRAMCRNNYDESAYALFRQIVSDVVAEAAPVAKSQKSATGTPNPSAKF